MSVLDLINASFNTNNYQAVQGRGRTSEPKANGGVTQKGNQTPTFGIKGRVPLTQDVFDYKGQKLSKEEAKTKSYADVYRHESAHLAAAGKYAASGIHIDFDGNGIATGGHVNVKMPTLNRKNLDETINHAQTVIKSAEAPASFDELSDADKNVAAQSRAVLSQALALKGKNNNKENDKQSGSKLNITA